MTGGHGKPMAQLTWPETKITHSGAHLVAFSRRKELNNSGLRHFPLLIYLYARRGKTITRFRN